jgi:hypothetical protein
MKMTLTDLPDDVLNYLGKFLHLSDLARFKKTSKELHSIIDIETRIEEENNKFFYYDKYLQTEEFDGNNYYFNIFGLKMKPKLIDKKLHIEVDNEKLSFSKTVVIENNYDNKKQFQVFKLTDETLFIVNGNRINLICFKFDLNLNTLTHKIFIDIDDVLSFVYTDNKNSGKSFNLIAIVTKNNITFFAIASDIFHCTKIYTYNFFLTLTENIKIYQLYDYPEYVIISRYRDKCVLFFVNNSNYPFPYNDKVNQLVDFYEREEKTDLFDELISDLRQLTIEKYNEKTC